MSKLAPSILSADFAHIVDDIRAVEKGGASYVHLDVMDGRFVPNITWGPKVIGDLRKHTKLLFDCHLMIVEPERYVEQFRKAGADIITFHLEATPHAQRLLTHIRSLGAKAGISICPQTPVALLEDLIDDVDLILVMSVNPGFGGQKFIPHALEKIAQAKALVRRCGVQCEVEVDGGITLENARSAVQAGADVLVVGSAIFDTPDCGATTAEFVRRIETAQASSPA
ncbi:MAG TPA: ribulose-phosphate 3-epimerase [Candidatus Baltobacteraceae bacterium]|nr:ribulose-phosphate 3-epimerase [Candidatus Baltobacteraceae bacterium]